MYIHSYISYNINIHLFLLFTRISHCVRYGHAQRDRRSYLRLELPYVCRVGDIGAIRSFYSRVYCIYYIHIYNYIRYILLIIYSMIQIII